MVKANSIFADCMLLPQLRGRVLSHDAALIFDTGISKLLWANAAGADLLNFSNISDAVSKKLPAGQGILQQIANAARQIEGHESVVRGFRTIVEGRAEYIQCELFRISAFADSAVLLTRLDQPEKNTFREHQRASALADACQKMQIAVAFVDEFGLIIAASSQMLELDFDVDTFSEYLSRYKSASETIYTESVSVSGKYNGELTIAQIADEPARYMLLCSEAGRIVDRPADSDIADPHEQGWNAEKPEPEPVRAISGSSDDSHFRSVLDRWYMRQADSETARSDTDSEKVQKEPEAPAGAHATKTEIHFDKRADLTAENTQTAIFRFAGPGEAVRFAWTLDAHGIFRSVSPELAQTIGPNAADIVGRSWRDVANVFGFDRTGEIAALLEKRDTWSGKSVLWPVQGTDLAVPIDLAALPAFGSGRVFSGFRGFGLIRTADTIIDPDATGFALTPGPHGDYRPGHAEDADSSVMGQITPPESDGQEAAQKKSNIVDLSSRKKFDDNSEEILQERLSGSEALAFREIGLKLGSSRHPDRVAGGNELASHATRSDSEDTGETITGQKRESLRYPEYDALDYPVIMLREDSIIYANPKFLEISGYRNIDEIAGGLDSLIGTTDQENNPRPKMLLVGKDGSEIAVNPVIQTVPHDGETALLLAFHPSAGVIEQDATPSDLSSPSELARIPELESILDTATDGIIVVGPEGNIHSLNASAEALFGLKLDGSTTVHLREFFARESRQTIDDYISEISQPGVASLLNDGREVIGKEANGGLIPLFVTLGRLGESEKFCAVLRDITQWKKAEEELVSARRAAETASEQKTEFLARVSHEIRTPLNAIIGFSDVMIEERFGPVDNDRYREYLRDINRSGALVLDLINDLLDISKIEAGKLDLNYEAVDLNQIVSETVALLQPQANGERIIIRTSLSRAVPQVVADARSIRQIILNLVSNAIKFTPMNGQVIVSTVYEGNGEVVLRVRDTGRGMTQNDIEHAMKPFNQIKLSAENHPRGTGLGLPLTKALVEANRAYFDMESTPGKGTIAHVHFPSQRVLAS
jgi:PAS domain S-box-containing protein